MKRALCFYTLGILLICNCQLFSQIPYNPFPKKFGRWVLQSDGPQGPGYPPRRDFTLYEANGDTLVNGYTYIKVSASDQLNSVTPWPNQNEVWKLPYGTLHLAFAYRNDIPNKKVYIITDTNKVINGKLVKEYLWYDFNLKAGDVLKTTFAVRVDNNTNPRDSIGVIDSVAICGGVAKKFNFKCGAPIEWAKLNSLIEGVGFCDNFITTDPNCFFEPLYVYTTYFTCTPTAIVNVSKNKLKINVFPNPASQTLQLKWGEHEQQKMVQWSIRDCLGNTVLENNSGDNQIDISHLSGGIYLIVVKDNEGNGYQAKFIKE